MREITCHFINVNYDLSKNNAKCATKKSCKAFRLQMLNIIQRKEQDAEQCKSRGGEGE